MKDLIKFFFNKLDSSEELLNLNFGTRKKIILIFIDLCLSLISCGITYILDSNISEIFDENNKTIIFLIFFSVIVLTSIYVNLYVSNEAQLTMADTTIELLQTAQMPWNGAVSIRVNPSETSEFSIKLRTPYWSQNSVLPFDLYTFKTSIDEKIQLTLNGKTIPFEIEGGYITLQRKWNKGDTIALYFPMKARAVATQAVVTENQGKIAIEKGPIVYAFEEIDNRLPLEQMEIPSEGPYQTQFQKKYSTEWKC